MKTTLLTIAVLLSLVRLMPAQTNETSLIDSKPLPTLDFLIQKVVARAVWKTSRNASLPKPPSLRPIQPRRRR
jgi:hypothetical protein